MRLPPTMSGSIQTAATDPPEEASPSGLVRFHALGLHPTPLVSILIDRNLHLMSHAYLNSPPRYSADRFRPHRHTDKGRPVKGGPSSMWDIFLFGWPGDTLLLHSDSVVCCRTKASIRDSARQISSTLHSRCLPCELTRMSITAHAGLPSILIGIFTAKHRSYNCAVLP